MLGVCKLDRCIVQSKINSHPTELLFTYPIADFFSDFILMIHVTIGGKKTFDFVVHNERDVGYFVGIS